jgi:uncharacterized protein YhaN
MRFLRITFRCFGPFEEQLLDFSQTGCLHIVFGPNEAGKSCALEGLMALLFGFPGQSGHNFRYQYSQFRIQAEMENRIGKLQCIRRKGNKDTLRKTCDKEVIPERELTEFIGGLDRTRFEQLFGLDAKRLVDGGEGIAAGQGELGEALFAAGAGMKGLRALSQNLERLQRDLYSPGGRNQKITQGLRQHRELMDNVRSFSLSPESYAAAEKADRDAADKTRQTADERRRVRARRDLINRYKAALPTIDLLTTARNRLALVSHAPLLSEDFDGRLEQSREKLSTATHEIAILDEDWQKLNEQIEECQSPHDVLREEVEIDDLRLLVGAAVKLSAEEVKARTFSIDELGKARDIFRDLTGSTNWDQMDALKPRLDQRDRIGELANQHSAIAQDVVREEGAVADASKQLEEKQRTLEQTPVPDDVGPLRDLVEDMAPFVLLEKQHDDHSNWVRAESQRLAADFGRFQPKPTIRWQDSLTLPVPLAEKIEHFRERRDRGHREVSQLEDQKVEYKRELESLRVSMGERIGAEPVPNLNDLSTSRGDRDKGLFGIRRRLDNQPDLQLEADFGSRYASGRPLIDAVEASVRFCDTLSDRLRHEADRIAAFHSLQLQENLLDSRISEIDTALESAKSKLEAINEHWRDSWESAGVVPDTPKVMQAWLTSWNQFCERLTALKERSRKSDEDKAQIDSLCNRLKERCLAAQGSETLAEGVAAVRRAVNDQTSLHNRRTSLEADVKRLREQLVDGNVSLSRAQGREQKWRQDWAEAIAVLQLKEGSASIETAQDYLSRIDQMQQHLRDMRIKDARIREIRADRDLLVERISRVRLRLDATARPTTTESLEADFAAVVTLIDDARQMRTQHQGLTRQQQEIARRRNAADKSLREAQVALQALADEAGVLVHELADAVQRARERAEASSLVRQYEEALAHHAQGENSEQFTQAALAGRGEIDEQISDLGRKVTYLDEEVSRSEAEGRDAARHLDGYRQASDAAADADQQAEWLAAKLGDEIREYKAVYLARAVLDMAKERYRERHQDTMLDRASAFFRTLTNEAFSAIEIDYEEGNDVLKAIRSSASRPDARVAVEGLSDGTRDQLFLALRLAGISQRPKEREPMPLVIDDVLINFDDDRARATLRCLAELAADTQVIIFTHHRHLVELARSVQPSALVLDMAKPA